MSFASNFLMRRATAVTLAMGLLLSLFQGIAVMSAPPADASAVGWQIQMMTPGKKTAVAGWTLGTSPVLSYGNPGTTGFQSATASSTGASGRTTFGAAEGAYSAFYNQTGITKVAFVDGSSTSLDPTTHTNYLIYDLVESTGSESFNAILKRLDTYISTCSCQNNDSLWGSASVTNLTAGANGYSGTLSASGGTGFKTSTIGSNTAATPNRFAVYGINRDSDNDQQTLVAYTGDLNTGKADSWRGLDPYQTFWSYWGGDFHSNSSTQRIGTTYVQTTPGVASTASWSGNVYLLAFTPNTDNVAPTFPSAETFSVSENQTTVATVTTSEAATISLFGGADVARFTVTSAGDSATALRFATAPNFEAPADVGANNVYEVVLRALDLASNAGYETITVTVTNANDAPIISSNGGGATATILLTENTSSVTTAQATDEDLGASLSFSISGTDASDFSINSSTGALVFATNPDFEAPADSDSNNSYLIIVAVSDSIATDTQTVTINISNVTEGAQANAPAISGPIYKGVSVNITITIDAPSVVRFFVNGKRIATCKDRVTSGTYPNNVATCAWKPSVMGRQRISATVTPVSNQFTATNSPSVEVFVLKRTTTR